MWKSRSSYRRTGARLARLSTAKHGRERGSCVILFAGGAYEGRCDRNRKGPGGHHPGVASVLARAGVNILDISQTTIREYFTMIMLVDLATATEPLREIQDRMAALGEAMGLSVRVQHEDLINAMHNV